MAEIINQSNSTRPQGSGFEGQGPDLDLPNMQGTVKQNDNPLKVTVPIGRQADVETVEQPTPQENKVNQDWGNIQKSFEAGYSRAEIADYISKTQGYSADEADTQIIQSMQTKIKGFKEAGYNDDEVRDFLLNKKVDPSIVDSALKTLEKPKPWKKYEWDPNTQAENVKDISDLYHNIYDKYSDLGKQITGVWNEEDGIEARRSINQINASIAAKMAEKGYKTQYDPSDGRVLYEAEDGSLQPVDSSLLNGLFNSKGEAGFSIAGSIAGGKLGARVAPGAWKIPAAAAGAFVGGMAGGAAGRGLDMMNNSLALRENIEAKLYMTQMSEAGIADGVFGVLGTGALKLGSAGGRAVMKGYDMVVAGNSKGAYKALLDNMLIDKDQAAELVANWEKLNERAAPGKTIEDKAISVIGVTKQGGELYLQPSVGKDPRLANTIVADINERAKGLNAAIETVNTEGVGKLLRTDLKAYQADVKEYYKLVKDDGASFVDGTDYRFDMEKLAVRPALEKVLQNVDNPRIKERFASYLANVNDKSAGRSFSDLLDLRQTVNGFKYATSKMKETDQAAVKGILKRIDTEIDKASKAYNPHHKEWTANFKQAKDAYSKMKLLEKNVLYKALTKKGVTEDSINAAIKDKINSLDGTFDEVLDKLPPATRARTEAAIIKQMTEKFTVGNITDNQAVHFPMLAENLKGIDIKTPEAKRLVNAINEMSKVYQNDINLSQITGKITISENQQYLTYDPVVRAKLAAASGFFKWFKHMIPSKDGNNLALIRRMSKLLENPMHSKTAEDFVRNMPKESQAEMRSLVKELQLQWGKRPDKPVSDWQNMYKQSANGKMSVTNGALGKGVYLFDKVSAGDGTVKVIKHEVNLSRMANMDQIRAMFGNNVMEKDLKNIPDLQDKLRDAGYLGVKLEGKAMLFPEKIVGQTMKKPTEKIVTQVERKASLDKTLEERVSSDSLTSGQGIATKEFSAINEIVKNLKQRNIGLKDAQEQADALGFTLIKRAKSGSAKNAYGSEDYTWSYVKKRK